MNSGLVKRTTFKVIFSSFIFDSRVHLDRETLVFVAEKKRSGGLHGTLELEERRESIKKARPEEG